MIVIPRGLARSVRALLRKCVSGRSRGPAPMVAIECEAGNLTVWAKTAEAELAYSASTRCADGLLVVPVAVLAAVEGGGDEPVELMVGPGLRGEARWVERGEPRTLPFDAILPGKQHRPPTPPDEWHPVSPDFLRALYECGRTTARESGRYALSRVQVSGRVGHVAGTDGRTALVWGGFDLPLPDSLLVPALPVFGTRELAAASPVRIGRTVSQLVVAAGPWRVFLPADTGGRYPDVAGVAPRTAPTVAGIDVRDAADLSARLPGLPGADVECRPVTLDLDGGVVVRAGDATGTIESVRLERSPSTGPRARVVIDRRILARALALGCVTVRIAPDKPVVFEGVNRTFITVALDPTLAVGADAVAPSDTTAITERRITMGHETNGHTPNGRHDPPAADQPDLLTAAEDLRASIADALAKAGRLVVALKSRKREQRVLGQVWSSLHALNLGPGGGP